MPQLRVLELKSSGKMKDTETWLRKLLKMDVESILKKYGDLGLEALAEATPKRTGKTSRSWAYRTKITRTNGKVTSAAIEWYNTNLADDRIPVVVLIECGHGTRRGGYVPPRPFVDDTLKPIFDAIADKLWEEVNNA